MEDTELKFNEEELKEVDKHISKYPEKKAAVMPVLWMAQKKFGYLSKDVMKFVGELLDLPYSHVYGVVTFYTMYFQKEMGKHHIQVCTNVPCMLRGGDKIYDHISKKLDIKHNEATKDKHFSLEEVECMGACGGAPMLLVNEDFYEHLDMEQVDKLIEELKDK